jgi:hypothetical protein
MMTICSTSAMVPVLEFAGIDRARLILAGKAPIQSSPPRKKMSFRSFDRFFMHSINMSHWCELFSVPRLGPKCGNAVAWKGDARLRSV